ncbi:MAG: hypothetical protein QXF29_05735, partial [Archaeoglobaceae archaeon]
MIKLSHVISYLTCPRLAYYRFNFGEDSFTEKQAVKEIYQSLRRGFGIDWAREKVRMMNKNYSEEIFNAAAKKFKIIEELKNFKTLDWDVVYFSEKLGVIMTVDELVEFRGETYPLFISLNAPKNGVWIQDSIKAGMASLIANLDKSVVYYAYSGEIRFVNADFGLKRKTIKLIERLKMIERGFLPERKESEYCKICSFAED